MKYVINVLVAVLTCATLNGILCKRVVIKTKSEERDYNYFPLKVNYLEFEIKAKNDVHILLSEQYNLDGKFYEIVIGGWSNTRSVMRRDDGDNVVVNMEGPIINTRNLEKYWVLVDKVRGSLSVGKSQTKKLIMYYKDPEFFSPSYFGISTGFGSTGLWYFDSSLFVSKCTNETALTSL